MWTSCSIPWSISAACSSPPSSGSSSAMFQPNARPRSTRSTRSVMNKSGANRLVGGAAIALLLAGCTVGPDYHPAEPGALGVPTAYAPPVTRPAPGELVPAEADLSAWWNQLGDPLLTDLIARATAGNLAIAQSVARLGQARES